MFLASIQPYLIRVTNKHAPGDTEKEIDLILNNESTIKDIEYHFPGIQKPYSKQIGVKTREELLKYSQTNKSAINSLKIIEKINSGLHSHKISGPNQESLEKAVKRLKDSGLLVGVNITDKTILKLNDII